MMRDREREREFYFTKRITFHSKWLGVGHVTSHRVFKKRLKDTVKPFVVKEKSMLFEITARAWYTGRPTCFY